MCACVYGRGVEGGAVEPGRKYTCTAQCDNSNPMTARLPCRRGPGRGRQEQLNAPWSLYEWISPRSRPITILLGGDTPGPDVAALLAGGVHSLPTARLAPTTPPGLMGWGRGGVGVWGGS